MNKKEFVRRLESICPLDLQESWDNCGFQVNTEKQDVNTSLLHWRLPVRLSMKR